MMKRLSHPFISELKRYVANQNSTLGPVVMSLSELIKPLRCEKSENPLEAIERVRGLQRKLSEVTDMIHAAHVFHRCVKDHLFPSSVSSNSMPTGQSKGSKILHQDNVMSLLIGDYLLAQSSVDMADLKYPRTVGLIAKGLEDYTRGEFHKLQLFERYKNRGLAASQEELRLNLEKYAKLTCGSLLSTACLSAVLLAGYPEADPHVSDLEITQEYLLSRSAFSFGYHTGTAHRLIEFLYCPNTNSEDDQQFLKCLDVREFTGSIRYHLDKAAEMLVKLPDGEKRIILLDLLDSMRNRCS